MRAYTGPEIDYHETVRTDADLARLLVYQQEVLHQTVTLNPWIPFVPFAKQAIFLASPLKEVLYGGALGAGKSEAILGAAAQYVDRPSYRAIIIRSTISELQMPGALIERSQKWWAGTAARYNSNLHRWKFPSGAEIWFGYLGDKNWSRYMSSEWDFVGFDEIINIPQKSYNMLYSRVRQSLKNLDTRDVPPRVRGASNPPTAEQEATGWWVKTKFVDRGFPYFIQASAKDNPFLDPNYLEDLRKIYDPVTFQKLAEGDWEIRAAGSMFRRDMFKIIPRLMPGSIAAAARGWDLAGTKPHPDNPDPDWTRGVRIARVEGQPKYDFAVMDMISMQDEPGAVANILVAQSALDGILTTQVIPQDPAQAGKFQKAYYERLLYRYTVSFVRESKTRGGKLERAKPLAIAAGNERIAVVEGPWNEEFFRELEALPDGRHDDILDGCSAGFNVVALEDQYESYESGMQDAFKYRPTN